MKKLKLENIAVETFVTTEKMEVKGTVGGYEESAEAMCSGPVRTYAEQACNIYGPTKLGYCGATGYDTLCQEVPTAMGLTCEIGCR